jgi:multidrug transporter EmrE-like cation transporter
MIPLRSVIVFFAGVFFVFAPIGLLLGSSFVEERPLHTLLLAGILSGCIAVSWAATATLSRWWIAGIVVFTSLQIAFFGPAQKTPFGIGSAHFSLEGVGSVVAIVLGYVLFVVFIAGQGRTALRLQTEMALARSIHETLVPRLEMSRPGFEVLGVSQPSTEMGGDLVDAVAHGESTDIVVADVSGHGVRAGVVMGMVKSAVRTSLLTPASLDRLLVSLNHVLEQTTSAEMYSTFAVLRLGSVATRVEYALAAHQHILHYRAKTRSVACLEQKQRPLGLFPQSTFETGWADVAPGDLLALYTDGLNETENAAGDALGHAPIERYLAERGHEPLAEIQRGLFDLAQRHGSAVDDQTILLVRIK